MVLKVAHFDKSLLSLVGRTLDRDGIRSCKYSQSKDNYNTTIAMCHV
jgi:hypothetical protein